MKKRPETEEDNIVIADMNVEGMPWYRKGAKKPGDTKPATDLTPGETWAAVRGMLMAALLIGGIFIVACLIFILLCLFVWNL